GRHAFGYRNEPRGRGTHRDFLPDEARSPRRRAGADEIDVSRLLPDREPPIDPIADGYRARQSEALGSQGSHVPHAVRVSVRLSNRLEPDADPARGGVPSAASRLVAVVAHLHGSRDPRTRLDGVPLSADSALAGRIASGARTEDSGSCRLKGSVSGPPLELELHINRIGNPIRIVSGDLPESQA